MNAPPPIVPGTESVALTDTWRWTNNEVTIGQIPGPERMVWRMVDVLCRGRCRKLVATVTQGFEVDEAGYMLVSPHGPLVTTSSRDEHADYMVTSADTYIELTEPRIGLLDTLTLDLVPAWCQRDGEQRFSLAEARAAVVKVKSDVANDRPRRKPLRIETIVHDVHTRRL